MLSRPHVLGKFHPLFPLSIPWHLSSLPPRLTNVDYRYRRIRTACKVPAVQNVTTSVEKLSEKDRSEEPKNWNVKMLYDGECPLCMRECRNFLNIHQCDQRKQQVTMLRERNKNYGTIKFIDISLKEYSAEENHRLDYATAMGRIHVISYDGTVHTDVDAFRRLYEEVGLGWVYAITKYEPVASIAGAVYALWAKYRLQITGRPSLENVLEERKKNMESCDNNSCRM